MEESCKCSKVLNNIEKVNSVEKVKQYQKSQKESKNIVLNIKHVNKYQKYIRSGGRDEKYLIPLKKSKGIEENIKIRKDHAFVRFLLIYQIYVGSATT